MLFMPGCGGSTERMLGLVGRYEGMSATVLRYGVADPGDEGISEALSPPPSGPALVHVGPEDRMPMFVANEMLSVFSGLITIDVTFASAFHAALLSPLGIRSNVRIVYALETPDGPEEVRLNPRYIDYGRLTEDDVSIVAAVLDGAGDVSSIVGATGFSDKKVYRRVAELARGGYITADSTRKVKSLSLTRDQEEMFLITTGLDRSSHLEAGPDGVLHPLGHLVPERGVRLRGDVHVA